MASVMYVDGRAVGVRAYAGIDPTTKRTRNLYHPLPPNATTEEINEELDRIQRVANFSKRVGKDATVAVMVEFYIDFLELEGAAPNTIASYRSNLRCYIEPNIGDVKIRNVDTFTFTDLYMVLLRDGGKDGHPLSPNTIKKLNSWLVGCFNFFMDNGFISSNPLLSVKLPRHVAPDIDILDPDEYAILYAWLEERIESGEANALDVAIYIDMGTGLRAGELSALKVRDFLQKSDELFVKKSLSENGKKIDKKSSKNSRKNSLILKGTKSEKMRKVSLDKKRSFSLKNHLKNQQKMLEKRGIKQTQNTPLFCKGNGTQYRPRTFNDYLKKVLKKLKLSPRIHLHCLRHTHATYLLEQGTSLMEIQERLGHYDITVTLKNYGHVLKGSNQRASADFSAYEQEIRTKYTDQEGI